MQRVLESATCRRTHFVTALRLTCSNMAPIRGRCRLYWAIAISQRLKSTRTFDLHLRAYYDKFHPRIALSVTNFDILLIRALPQHNFDFIASQRDLTFTYEGGHDNGQLPSGYTISITIAFNSVTASRSSSAQYRHSRKWKQFDLGWVSIVPAGVAVKVGSTVAVKVRAFGTWSPAPLGLCTWLKKEDR